MNDLAYSIKIEPNERVEKINKFIALLEDTDKKPNKMSPKEKLQHYGIKIQRAKEDFKAYYIKPPSLYDGNNKIIEKNYYPVVKSQDLNNLYCVYEKDKKGKKNNYDNYDISGKFYDFLCKVSKSYKIKVSKPKKIEVPNNSSANSWINQVEKYISKEQKDFAVVFIINNENLYPTLKKYSLCKNGFISQIIKSNTINKSGLMSICSKILLQITSKLGGTIIGASDTIVISSFLGLTTLAIYQNYYYSI